MGIVDWYQDVMQNKIGNYTGRALGDIFNVQISIRISRKTELYVRRLLFADPRTSDWFMVTGPGPLFMIIMSYIYFSLSAGPRYMRDKKPYTLKNTLILYNFVQVLLSIFLVYEAAVSGWLTGYSFSCQPVDRSMDPKAMRVRVDIL